MQAQDGWIVRVRPHCASLTAAQWLVLAKLAQTHAAPQIELTRLGNVQLRGVHESALPALRSELIASGLAPADEQADLAPAVHCTPFYATGDRSHALAQALSAAAVRYLSPLALRKQSAGALPGKFGMLVDDPERRLRSMSSDLHLWAAHDGSYGLALGQADECYYFESDEHAVQAAIQVARWFARERMTSAARPAARLHHLLKSRTPNAPALGAARHYAIWANEGAGPLRPGTPNPQGLLIGAPLGRVDAPAMQKLAAGLPAHSEIRVTPWKSLLVLHEESPAPVPLRHASQWITRPTDMRLRVSACTGAPGCPQAHIPAQSMALQIADWLLADQHLHISGCAKLCALPADATHIVFAGTDASGQVWLNTGPAGPQQRPLPATRYRASSSDLHDIQQQLHDPHL